MRLTEQEFRAAYPLIAEWIHKTLAEHASAARPVATLGSAKSVIVPRVQSDDLRRRLSQFWVDITLQRTSSITYGRLNLRFATHTAFVVAGQPAVLSR